METIAALKKLGGVIQRLFGGIQPDKCENRVFFILLCWKYNQYGLCAPVLHCMLPS
jgi:hypothetical protein